VVRYESKPVDWADAQCALSPIDRTFRLARPCQHDTAKKERKSRRRTQRQRPLKCPDCRHTVMLHNPDCERAERQGCRIVAAMSYGSTRMSDGCAAILIVGSSAYEENLIAPGEQAVRNRVVALERERLLEQRQSVCRRLRHGKIDRWESAQH